MGPAQALQGRLAGIAATITSGAFVAFIKTSLAMQDEMSKSAIKAGVTTEKFSGMAFAARLADVDITSLAKAYTKLNALLIDGQQGQKEAAETFRRLKLDPKSLKDADDLLLALADRFSLMEEGAARSALAIDVFGERVGPGLLPMLVAGRAGLEELRAEAARLGVVVDTQTGKAAEEFNDTLTRMATRTKGIGLSFATTLLPALQAVASEFVNVERSGGAVDFMGSALRITFETLAILWANVSFVLKSVGREIAAWVAQINTLQYGGKGFSAISDAVKADAVKARAELDDFEQRVMQLGKYAPGAKASGKPDKPAGKPWAPLPKIAPETKDAADKSQMAALELRLAEEKRVVSVLDQGAEYGKQRELDYWRHIVATAQLSSADRIAVLRKAATLEVEIAGKANKDRRALDMEVASQAETMALGKLDGERAAAKAALELGQITTGQQLQLELQYEEQRYQIQRAALDRRLQLLADDPATSEVERQRQYGRLLQIEQQHQQQMLQIQTGLAKQSLGTQIFDSLGSSFGNALNGMLSRTMTWYQALSNIFSGVRDIFIAEVVTKPVAQYIAAQARMLAIKLGFVSAEKSVEVSSSATTVAIKGGEATTVVAANAAMAGSGAAASVASIPFVGPMLALAAMAAVFAAVSSLGGKKSAAGGYDIPSGINPMTQLHEEEMVLPKYIANPMRQALAADGMGGSGGSRGDLNLSVRGASAGEFFMLHKNDLVKALKSAHRGFAFSPP